MRMALRLINFHFLALLLCNSLSSPSPHPSRTIDAAVDIERADVKLERLAFGSCSKALWPQRLWGAVRAKSPQMWLWTGDAVYLGGDQPISLEHAFNAQLQQEVLVSVARLPFCAAC